MPGGTLRFVPRPVDATTVARRPRRHAAPPVPTLRVLFTGQAPAQRVLVLRAGELVVGRAPDGASVLALPEDPLLSRAHARIERSGASVTVTDLGSRNGSSLDGEALPAHAPVTLDDGAVLRLGDTLLLFRLVPPDGGDASLPGLRGTSPAVRGLRADLARAAPTDASVVLLGASGTGKGVAARALHEASGRRGPFVQVNCAAIPDQLAESQLFGHRAGAFTGAREAADGVFREADGGTLFLDEIGDLPAALQPKLLHAVEEGAVVPVGATKPVPVDVRLVVATSRELEAAVRDGAFRGDLYARLAELVLRLPTLAERREDVLDLLVPALGDDAPPLDADLAEALVLHDWPFNVRELLKTASELRVRGSGRERLELALVAERLAVFDATGERSSATTAPSPRSRDEVGPPGRDELEEMLRAHRGVVADVGRAVGRSRKQVYRWLRSHDLDPADYR